MKSALRALASASALILLLSLPGCGGSDGGGGEDRGNVVPPSFRLSTNSLTFSAASTTTYVPPQSVGATVNGVSAGTLYFRIVVAGVAVQSVSNVTATGPTTGAANVLPANPATLGLGTHRGTITVTACLNDPTCSTGVLAGSPQVVDVTYQIGGLVTSPSAVNFSVIEGAAPAAANVNVAGNLLSGAGSLTTSVRYVGSTSGWLSVTPASSASLPATLQLAAAQLPVGSYAAVVNLGANGTTLPLPVNYNVLPNLGVSTTSASFSAVRGQASLPAATVVPVTAARSGPVPLSPTVAYGPGASGWLSVTGSSAPGNLTIVPNTTNLNSGATYTATVSVAPTDGGTAPIINVSYTVGASVLRISPAAHTFSIDAASTAADQYLVRSVSTSDTGAALDWTAVSSAPWLSVTSSGVSGDAAALTLVPSALVALPNGASSATVTFSFSNATGASGQLTLGVTVNVNLPSVNFVSPYVASSNTPGRIILRGAGFSSVAGRPIAIGSTTVSTYTVVNNSEIQLDHPALAAGSYPVKIETALGIDRTDGAADLVVVTPPSFAATTLAYPNANAKTPLNVIYDAERRALVVPVAYPGAGSGGDILRYAYSGSSWAATPISQYVPTFRDLALSPDGKKLISVSDSSITQFDSSTLATGTITNATGYGGFYYLKNAAMTNDGKMLVTTGLNGSGSTAVTAYDVRSASFLAVSSYPTNYLYFGTPGASSDGSRVVFVQGSLSPAPSVMQYDASTGSLTTTGINRNQSGTPSLDRTGSRIVINGSLVFDRNFVQIGSIPCSAMQTALSPDGSRAYCYSAGGLLRRYDLSVSPVAGVFPEIGSGITLAGNPGASPKLALSPDGGTMFIAGQSGIVIQPLP
jgi:hypothetical protein